MESRLEGQVPLRDGGRSKARWWQRFAGGGCRKRPRTLSAASPVQPRARPLSPVCKAGLGLAPLPGSPAVSAAEVRDQLRPLPALEHQHTSTSSGSRRSARGSMASMFAAAMASRSSTASLGTGGGPSFHKRAAFPSRSFGSLTAWQMLAADVKRAMEQGAREAGIGSGEYSGSDMDAHTHTTSSSSHNRSSMVEPHLVMEASEEGMADEIGALRKHSVPLLGASSPHWQAPAACGRRRGGSAGSAGSGSAPVGSNERSSSGDGSDGSGEERSFAGEASLSRFESQYEVLGELGRGAFGCALKARRRRDGMIVCLKVLDSDTMGAQERRMSRDEVRVLSAMAHPNIVLYHDCFHEGGKQHIAMEFCEEGDLEQLLKERKGLLLSEGEVMLKFVQLCLALQHVHTKGIIHRDIKSSNIFCTRHGILKLGDFGISKIMAPGKSHARTMVGTPYYFSPELVEDKPYSKKADVWAAGCVLYELTTLLRPFRGSSVSAIAVKILRGAYAPLPDTYSPELHQLVATLLRRRPDQRPSINEVLSMDYVRLHMRRYREHVQRTVEHRKQSYFRSLDMFQLDGHRSSDMAGDVSAAAVMLRSRKSALMAAELGRPPLTDMDGIRPRRRVGPHRLSAAAGPDSVLAAAAMAGAAQAAAAMVAALTASANKASPAAVTASSADGFDLASALAAAIPSAAAAAAGANDTLQPAGGSGGSDGASSAGAHTIAPMLAVSLPASAWASTATATSGVSAVSLLDSPADSPGRRPSGRVPKQSSFSAVQHMRSSSVAAALAAVDEAEGGSGGETEDAWVGSSSAGSAEADSQAAQAGGVQAMQVAAASAAVAAQQHAMEPQQLAEQAVQQHATEQQQVPQQAAQQAQQQAQQAQQQQQHLHQLLQHQGKHQLLPLAHLAAGKGRTLSLNAANNPSSPQSLLPETSLGSSIQTAGSEAASLAAAASTSGGPAEPLEAVSSRGHSPLNSHSGCAVSGNERVEDVSAWLAEQVASEAALLEQAIADADLVRQASRLMAQMQQLLDAPAAADGSSGTQSKRLSLRQAAVDGEERGRARRASRRAAVQWCSEEFAGSGGSGAEEELLLGGLEDEGSAADGLLG